ncbi:hypothetical protein KBB27_03150 [Patescibacteria group bacterium]|nr:hypothetical protein [Patescibacteria group bacterium]
MKRKTLENRDVEAEAIAAITSVLKDVPDERKTAVLSFVSQRFGGNDLGSAPASHGGGGEIVASPADNIKAFLKGKNPANKYQQTAVLAYYLKKNNSEEQFGKESIETANQQAGGRTIDDITGTLNDAKNKYGFFGAGAGGKKILLAYGEDVVEALPNQEKVKALMKANISKSKRKAKKKKAQK